jgi:hypothetical protein
MNVTCLSLIVVVCRHKSMVIAWLSWLVVQASDEAITIWNIAVVLNIEMTSYASMHNKDSILLAVLFATQCAL